MTAAASRVKVKTPKSGSERLELVLLEDNNKASISSSLAQSAMMQPHTQPTPQPTPTQPYQPTITASETRNDNNTTYYLPNQYNTTTNNTNNNIDDNSSYLTGCSASTAETDNRASSYNNNRNNDSLEMSWSREFTDVNAVIGGSGARDGRREGGAGGVQGRENGVQGRENDDDESDLYGSLEQCESIVNINDVLSNTVKEGGAGRSGSPVNSESVVAKDEQQPLVVEVAVNTVAAVESEEETSQQSPPQPIQSSPTNLQYKKSVSFDQSLDELLTSATTTTSEEEQSSASSSAASDKKKKNKKSKKKKGSDGSVKSEDTSVESVGCKVKTTFGSSGKKNSTPKSKQKQSATPSKSNSIEEEEDTENNPSFSSQQQQQQQQQKRNNRKSAPKVLRVSKYSKQKSTSSSLTAASSSKVVEDTTSSSNGLVDADKVEVKQLGKGKSKSKDKKTSLSTTRSTNDVESACSVVTEPLLDVLMREEQQQQQQNVNKEGDVPEVVQEQEKSVTRRELRKQRTTPSEAKYDNGDLQQYGQQQYGHQQQQQQPRLQHRRTLPRDHPNYQSQRSDQYNNQYRDDTNSSIQRSNSNISNATSLYSAYSNVALDGYVDPNLTTSGGKRLKKKKKEKKEKKGLFRKTARVAIKGVKGGKKMGRQFMKKVKDWYDDDDDDEEYDVDDYGASVVMTEYDYGNDAQYSFEGYDHLKSPRSSPRGGSTPPSVPSHQGNGTLVNPWTGIGGQQGGKKEVTPNFANNNNPWSGIQSTPQAGENQQQQHGEYNQEDMPQIKWWTWKQKEKPQRATAADDEEDETSNESMEYTYFAFLSKVKAS